MEADKYGGELESSINFEIFKIDSAIHREEISLYRKMKIYKWGYAAMVI